MFTQLNQYRVVLEGRPELQVRPEDLQNVYLRSSAGGSVPLRSLATVETANTPLSVNHQGQFPVATVSFNLAPDASLGGAVRAIEKAREELGLPESIQAGFQGTARAFGASLTNTPLLILAALVTVYILLGVLYESTIHPITILSTLPSAGVGALLSLILCRHDFSVVALIGIILLIGIVEKNAIMMIDFALDAERQRQEEARGRDHAGRAPEIPADHHDDDGRAARRRAPRARERHRLGAAGSRSGSRSWAGSSSASS